MGHIGRSTMETEPSIALHPSAMIDMSTNFGLFAGRLSDKICHAAQGARAGNHPPNAGLFCRGHVAALVRGPARHPPHHAEGPAAGPCSAAAASKLRGSSAATSQIVDPCSYTMNP